MTFNKLRDVPDETREEPSTQAVPWWATFTRPPARPDTVTVSSVTASTAATAGTAGTAATAAISKSHHSVAEPWEDEDEHDDNGDENVVFNTVRFQPVPSLAEKRKSQNKGRPGADTVGKLINVTGRKSNHFESISNTVITLSFRRQCSDKDDAWTYCAC